MVPQCVEEDNCSEHEEDCNQTPINPPLLLSGQDRQNENQEPLHVFGCAAWFSSLDLMLGYWQVYIKEVIRKRPLLC
ncbi:203_t:CDS:2 [Gigaspora rosea]|nr:203_t:CDS:2 [Gigaspora rosea]